MKRNLFFLVLVFVVITVVIDSAYSEQIYTIKQNTPFVWGGTTSSSVLPVSGTMGSILDINIEVEGIQVNSFSSGIEDFDLLLVGPGGTTAMLMSFACDNTAGPLDLTFDDAPSDQLPDGSSGMTCLSGTFLPSDHSVLSGEGYALDIPPAPLPPYGALLDFEGQFANGNWTLFAEERDGDQGGIITGWTLTIITDAEGCPNPPNITTTSLPNGAEGVPYNQAVQATGGTPPYSYTVITGNLPFGLNIDFETGVISGTPTAAGMYGFVVHIFDSLGCQDSQALSITVLEPGDCVNPPNITTTTLPDGTEGDPYNQTVQATDGTPPYSWSKTSGILPPGLSIDSATGAISGTPTSPGVYQFTVQVDDSLGCQDSQSFTITILDSEDCPTGPNITTTTVPDGREFEVYRHTVEATGGTPPYTWSYTGDLPEGFGIGSATGEIVGIAHVGDAGTYIFTVHIVDSLGCFDTKTFSLSIGIPACVYKNLFDDGFLEWEEEKPTVTESSGSLNLTPLKNKSIAVADAAFSGASVGTYIYTVQFTGGLISKNWLYVNRTDKKDSLEILTKPDQGKVVIKDRLGSVQAKAKGNFTFTPNTPYTFVTNYDGTNVDVSINGTPVIVDFVPSRILPSANIGAAVKNGSLSLDGVCVQ